MTRSAETMLLDIYDAWRAHNVDWLASYLPDDFSHSINIPIETHELGGARHGKAASLKRLRELFSVFDTQHLEMGSAVIDATGAEIEVHTHCRHKPSGALLKTTKRNLWRLEDGWPVDLHEIYDLDQFQLFLDAVGGD